MQVREIASLSSIRVPVSEREKRLETRVERHRQLREMDAIAGDR